MARAKRITPAPPPDYITATLSDPATSTWLKTALRAALQRDPVDVETRLTLPMTAKS